MRLNYNQKSFVIARDRQMNRVKRGGLGAFGVGEMWFDVEERDKLDPNFETAPEEKSFIFFKDIDPVTGKPKQKGPSDE